MTTAKKTFHLPNETATDALATQVADTVLSTLKLGAIRTDKDSQAGRGVAIYLQGDLGAGKTAFARAFLRRCGVTGRIKSPSYALLESYKVSSLYFYHIDFYRFNDPREWEDVGFRELFGPDSVVLIEWPEKADGQLPPPDLQISIRTEGDGRNAKLHAETERGQQWLQTMTDKTPLP